MCGVCAESPISSAALRGARAGRRITYTIPLGYRHAHGAVSQYFSGDFHFGHELQNLHKADRLTMIEGHDAIQTWSHSSGCFFIITAAMPDAMGAAGKQVEVV